jgi:hypothetical protein
MTVVKVTFVLAFSILEIVVFSIKDSEFKSFIAVAKSN